MSTKLAKGIVKKSTSYFANPMDIVRRPGFNPRHDFGEMEELIESIRENGFFKHKPLVVRRDEYGFLELIDGDRRFTAVEELLRQGHKFEEGIPVVIEDKNISEVDALILMFTANTSKQFNPLEEASAYQRMVEQGMSIAAICKRIGKSDVHVYDRLSLLKAAPEVRAALKENRVNTTLAEMISNKTKGDHKKQKELLEKATTPAGKKAVIQELTKAKPSLKVSEVEELQAGIESIVSSLAADANIANDVTTLKEFSTKSDELCLAYYAGAKAVLKKLLESADFEI